MPKSACFVEKKCSAWGSHWLRQHVVFGHLGQPRPLMVLCFYTTFCGSIVSLRVWFHNFWSSLAVFYVFRTYIVEILIIRRKATKWQPGDPIDISILYMNYTCWFNDDRIKTVMRGDHSFFDIFITNLSALALWSMVNFCSRGKTYRTNKYIYTNKVIFSQIKQLFIFNHVRYIF
jgi:hypothetical protein